jgi:hypothetical protein
MNKKGNCLYLLGAGASCEVLPLVSEFEKGLNDFSKELSEFIESEEHKMQEDIDLQDAQNLLNDVK